MKRLLLLVTTFACAGCFDFDGAYSAFCDGGQCGDAGAATGGSGGGTSTGGGAATGGGANGGGTGGGTTGGGTTGGGTTGGGGGTTGGGTGDGGCGGPAQLDLVVPANPLGVAMCLGVAKARVLDACGAPVTVASDLGLSFTAASGTLVLYEDNACSISPGSWAIPTGTSEVSFYLRDPTPGMTTLRVDSTGLDGSVRTLDFGCGANQRSCPTGCVPAGGCCDDTECNDGGVAFTCSMTSHRCVPPACQIPAGCGIYDDRTAAAASRTVTFNSSGYTPKCMRVTTSQDVTFSGDFFLHPLQQFCGPADVNMTQTNGTTKTVRFGTFGTYGYRCANHPSFEQGSVRTP